MFYPGFRRAQSVANWTFHGLYLSFDLAGGGILIWAQAVRDQEAGPGAGVAVAVLAACAELDHVFHSPLSVSPAGEELRFPVLQTNKWMEVFTQYRVQPFWSPARQLNCFVFHFFVSMLLGVLYVRVLKGSILLAAFTQANSAFMWHRLLCRIHCAALCSPFLGRLMTIGSAELGCTELLLERQCSKADKVIKILSSDSFGACPEVVWDYSY